jgi:hypothetical protein
MSMLPKSNLIKRFFFLSMPFFAPDDAAPAGGGGDPAPTDDEKKAADEKSKQEALNKQFAERAERGKEAGRAELLKELGITDPEEAKKLLETARKADEEKKTALEKEQAAREKAEKDAAAAKAAADEVLAKATTKLMNAEIKMSASTAVLDKDGKVTRAAFRAEAMDDVLLLLNREGIQEKDGTFTGVAEALANLAKTKPWLLAEPKTEKPARGNETGTGSKGRGTGKSDKRTPIISGL